MNKNRRNKEFSVNDIVFTIDRQVDPGNTRPLKTKFHPSLYVILKPYYTTCLIQRLSDGFRALYSIDHSKKYKEGNPLFQDLHGPVGPQASKLAKISKNEKFFWCPSLKNTQILTMSSALGSILCSTWKTQNFGCPQIFNSQHFLPWPPVSEKM